MILLLLLLLIIIVIAQNPTFVISAGVSLLIHIQERMTYCMHLVFSQESTKGDYYLP